jgi:hypothetical protein
MYDCLRESRPTPPKRKNGCYLIDTRLMLIVLHGGELPSGILVSLYRVLHKSDIILYFEVEDIFCQLFLCCFT